MGNVSLRRNKRNKFVAHPSTGYSPNEMMNLPDDLKLASLHKNAVVDNQKADQQT